VVLLSEHAIPFSEVTAHQATLEEAYLELTKDAGEFQAGGLGDRPSGLAGRAAS
jgi:ABC-2 type transport system ATP-binding protein